MKHNKTRYAYKKKSTWWGAGAVRIKSMEVTVQITIHKMATYSNILFFFFTPIFLPGKFHGQRILLGYMVHGVAKAGHEGETEHHHQFIK